MNRFRKEARIKHIAYLENCSPLEMKRFEYDESVHAKIFELARRIHVKSFPEEYDFQLDSIADAKDRSRGINPMTSHYIQRINRKRAKQRVAPLQSNGMPDSTETWEACLREAEAIVRGG